MEDRKIAAGVTHGEGQVVNDDQMRAVWSGLDLELAEVDAFRRQVMEAAYASELAGIPGCAVAAGMYFDGIATGILIAEQREKAGEPA